VGVGGWVVFWGVDEAGMGGRLLREGWSRREVQVEGACVVPAWLPSLPGLQRLHLAAEAGLRAPVLVEVVGAHAGVPLGAGDALSGFESVMGMGGRVQMRGWGLAVRAGGGDTTPIQHGPFHSWADRRRAAAHHTTLDATAHAWPNQSLRGSTHPLGVGAGH